MVISLGRGAGLHMGQLMPLPLTVSCFSKIQIGFTILVLAHLGSPGKHTHTHTHPFTGPLSRTTRVSRYQKAKPIWILLKQDTVRGSGISWAICKSAPCSRQITMPTPHHSVFTGQMPFLPPNQQRQSTEGKRAVKWVCVCVLTSTTDYLKTAKTGSAG